jgi:hypothetical protein
MGACKASSTSAPININKKRASSDSKRNSYAHYIQEPEVSLASLNAAKVRTV